jgi:hypothetical protein
MGRLLPLNKTGHNNQMSLPQEWALSQLIEQSGFIKKNE